MKMAVKIRGRRLNVGDYLSVINYLVGGNRTWESLRLHERTSVRLFRDFFPCPDLAAFMERLALFFNNFSKEDGITASYLGTVSHLLSRYDADTVPAKADEKKQNFKQMPLTRWNYSKEVCHLTLKRIEVYNKQFGQG